MKTLSLEEIKEHAEALDNMDYLSKRHPAGMYALDEIFSKEHILQMLHTAREYHRMREALSGLLRKIDDGSLVRNATRDYENDWGVRALHLVMAIQAALKALKEESESDHCKHGDDCFECKNV